jgi:hypothetical protein
MYVCMTDTPLNKLIFQLGNDLVPVFLVGEFKFRYLRSFAEDDSFIYDVCNEDDFRMQLFVLGVDVLTPTASSVT